MSKGIYTAVSGAIANSARLDTIANNLANVNTTGFKRDGQLFREYLTSYEKEPGTITVPRVPASIESFYDMQGGDKSYVDAIGTYTDFTQGPIKNTGNKLDLALEGNGLMEIMTPQGVRYTRDGALSIDGEGKLVTKQGFPVLSQGAPGSDPAGRQIKVSGANVTISTAGEVFDGTQNVGRLSLVKIEPADALRKVGHTMYTTKDNMEPKIEAATDTKVHQGFIEGSNVNSVREMTEMIQATRLFESSQKGIQAYDSMMGKAVNDVPKLMK